MKDKDKDKNEETLNDTLNENQTYQKVSKVIKSKPIHELLFQGTSDLMLYLNIFGRIVRINKAGLSFSGFSEEEIIGKLFWKVPGVFSKRNIPKFLKIFKNSLKGKSTEGFVSDLKEKSGKTHIMDFSTYPIKEANKMSSILVIAKDITEQKKIEKALLETKDKFRLMAENTGDLIAITKLDSTYTYISPSHKKTMGYTYDDLIGKRGLDFVHPDDKKKLFSLLRTYVSAKGKKLFTKGDSDISKVIEYRVEDKEGKWHYLESTANFIGNEILLISKDITERKKKVEKTLRESEEKFSNLAEQSPNMIYINQKGKVVYVNKACEEILEYARDEFHSPNFDFFSLIAPEFKETVKKSFNMHKEGKEVSPYEYALITKKGERIEAIHATKLIQYEGENAILGIVTDITKRKKIEENIRQMKDHLQNVIDSTSELVLVIDNDFKISTWNKTAEIITGYKRREIIGKSIKSLDLIDNLNSVIKCLENISKNKITPFNELILRTKTGAKRLLQVTYSSLKTGTEDAKGVLVMGKDITQESETHGKLMLGNSYIITDKTNDSVTKLFKDLVVSGYNGLFITRDTSEAIQNITQSLEEVEAIVLSQDKIKGFEHVMDLDELATKIGRFTATNSRPLILLDRIDYLLTNFSFDAVIKVLYRITNIIARNKGVLLMRLNPSVVNTSQLALIEEELKLLPSQKIDAIDLEDYLFGVLTFIDEQNRHNALVSFKKIGQKFSISRVTTAKRLNILEENGLIFIKKHGKSKTVHISEKGKTLLHRRKII